MYRSTIAAITALAVLGFDAKAALAEEYRLSGGLSYSAIEYIAEPVLRVRDTKSRRGLFASVRFVTRVGELLAMEAGLDYGTKGGSARLHEVSPASPTFLREWELDYLTLPILLRFQREGSGPFIKFGTGIDWIGNAWERSDGQQVSLRVRSVDPLVIAGAGIDWKLGSATGFVQVEGAIGVGNALADSENATLRNRTARIGVGVVHRAKRTSS